MKLVTTTFAILAATAFGASAMTYSTVAHELKFQGYNAEVVDSLTVEQLSKISNALHSGSDSDARGAVASLIRQFAG